MRFDDYAFWAQLGLSLLFAVLVARVAARKGRHPFGAALLMLAFANGWPLVWSAIGRTVATGFHVNDLAVAMMARLFGYGGFMFGVALAWVIVGCWKPRAYQSRARSGTERSERSDGPRRGAE